MRERNMRLVYTGIAMVVLAVAFFLGMMMLAPRSTDPVKLMETVGTVSGAVIGLAAVLIVMGFVGRKTG